MKTNDLHKDLENAPVQLVAELCGITRRTLSTLIRNGVIEKNENGKLDAFEVLSKLRERERQKDTPVGSAVHELRKEQARKHRIDNDIRESQLIPAEDVQAFSNEFAALFFRALKNLRLRMSAIMPTIKHKKMVDDECLSAKQTLSDRLESFTDGDV